MTHRDAGDSDAGQKEGNRKMKAATGEGGQQDSGYLGQVMEQIAACAAHVGRGVAGQPEGGLTLAGAEGCMERFRASVHILLSRHLGEECALAMGAYDLGIATGFYGWRSAVAVGLRARYEAARAQAGAGGAGRWHGLAEGLLHAGYRHGRDMLEWVESTRE